mgnify:FL=1
MTPQEEKAWQEFVIKRKTPGTPEYLSAMTEQANAVGMTVEDYMKYGYQTPVVPSQDYLNNIASSQNKPVSQSITQTRDSSGNFLTTQSTNAPSNPVGQLTNALGGVLSNLSSQGLTINPNKQLGPNDVSEFLKKAEGELSPYFAEQLKVGRQKYLQSVGYDIESIQQSEQQLEQKYGKEVRGIGESAAESGFAQSGRRQLEEQELAQATQQQINQGRRALTAQTGGRALDFAGQYGSRNLPQFDIGETPQVGAGESKFGRTGRNIGLYNINDGVLNDIVGSQEKERASSIRDLGQFYEGQYRQGQTIPTQNTSTYTNPLSQTTTQAPRTISSTTINPNYFLGQGETIDAYKKRLNLNF